MGKCYLLAFHGVLLLFCIQTRAQTVEVIDAEGHSTAITAEQIAKLPHSVVEVMDHDAPAKFEGIPVSTLLSSVGVLLGDKLRGSRLTEGLLIEASDGYKVLFALAEVDPAFATREIILADKRDGKSLDVKEGPLRIVAPGDKRPARWIREVTKMSIVLVNGGS
jgi:hypothetical protein